MAIVFGKSQSKTPTPQAAGSIRVQSSVYGLPIPLLWGRNRMPGNLLWYDDFVATPVKSQPAGGKGGLGSGSPQVTGYTYKAAVAIGLCEGPVESIGKVWEAKSTKTLSSLGGELKLGTSGQTPWAYLTANHPSKALSYSDTAYVAFGPLQLGESPNLPNFTFEVQGPFGFSTAIPDANPGEFIPDFLAKAAWPVGKLASMASFLNYCQAADYFFSPVIDQQTPAREVLQAWADACYAEFLWSNGQLKIIPYETKGKSGNGATYVPDITILYDLDDTDFRSSIECERADLSDAYNQVKVEFSDRDNKYNANTIMVEDAAHIDQFGLRPAPIINAPFITKKFRAQKVAQNALWRQLYVKSVYTFKLGWRHCLLEAMDYVTLTDPTLGLDHEVVRIISVEEDEDGLLTIKAEEVPDVEASPAEYGDQDASMNETDHNADPGSVNAPVLFEAPAQIAQTANGLEVWIAVSGADPNWGGCEVWVSTDGTDYFKYDRIDEPARTGVLTGALPIGSDTDVVNTLSVDMAESRSRLSDVFTADADSLISLCYVGGELLAYANSSLVSGNEFDLTYLKRGVYGTATISHSIGAKFARLDNRIVRYPFSEDLVGTTLYFKFPSFNVFGQAGQSLDEAAAYSIVLNGNSIRTDFNHRGEYSGTTEYFRGDAVTFGGATYVLTVKGPVKGDEPPSANWTVISQATTGAPRVLLSADSFIFTATADNVFEPPSQTITLTATLENLTGTPTFTAERFNNLGVSMGNVTLGGSGLVRTLTEAQFAYAKTCVVTAELSGQSDTVTVSRVRDGLTTLTGLLTNEAHTIQSTSTGSVPSFSGAGGTFRVYRGDDDITTGFGVVYALIASSGVSGSINSSTGVYTISSMSANTGTLTFTATVDGVVLTKVYSIAKSLAGEEGEGGVSAVISPAAVTVRTDSSGGVLSGQFPMTAQTTVYSGGVDVTGSCSFSRVQSGCSSSVSSSGVVTINSVSADSGYVEVTATYSGTPVKARVTFSKVKDGAAGGGIIDTAEDTTLSLRNASTYATTPNGTTGAMDGMWGATCSLYVFHRYQVSSGSASLAGKFQYSLNNSTWTDCGPEVRDSLSATVNEPSGLLINQTFVAPAGATTIYFRYLNRRWQGTASMTNYDTSSFTVAIRG